MFKITTDAWKMERQLKRMGKEAFPRAMAAALTHVAKSVEKRGARNIQKDLTVRTPYTMKSLRTSEARAKAGGRVGYAQTGSVSPYLPIQEKGGTIRARRRRVPIPTLAARGGDKRKAIRRQFRLTGARNNKMFILRPASPVRRLKKPGLFYRQSKKRLLFLRDLAQATVTVKPTRWHSAAVRLYGKRAYIAASFVRAAKRELARLGRSG